MTYEAQEGRAEYKPDDLVTIRQIADYYGCKITVPSSWSDNGKLKTVKFGKSTRGLSVRLFRWSDVLALNYIPGFLDQEWIKAHCPRRHLTAQEAANRIGRSAKEVNLHCAEGRIPCVKVPAPGISGRFVWYPTEKGVEDFLERRKAADRKRKAASASPQDASGTKEFPARPLIHPDHEVALEARLERMKAQGFVWPRKYQSVGRKKKLPNSSRILLELAHERG